MGFLHGHGRSRTRLEIAYWHGFATTFVAGAWSDGELDSMIRGWQAARTAARRRPALTGALLALAILGILGLPYGEVVEAQLAIATRPAASITIVQDRWAGDAEVRIAALPLVPAPEHTPIQRQVAVRKGDTLMDLLVAEGVPRAEAHDAIAALKAVFNPRKIRPGQELTLTFGPAGADGKASERGAFAGLAVAVGFAREATVSRTDGGGFAALAIERPITLEPLRIEGTIESSLFVAGAEAGVPAPVLVDLIRAFSFDVDFQRDIRKGDWFELLMEQRRDEAGVRAPGGEIVYAALILRGKAMRLYRFTTPDGITDFFDEAGASARKSLLKTPVDGARLSSGFGVRKHPILGYSLMHRGVDFAAPRGTPIMAAGNGTVERAGPDGAYGNYVRIRHNATYSTAYAHLKAVAPGIKRGSRVKQRQIVGYVGSTGRSTGPHLHYEVLVDGNRTDPRTLELPSGIRLEGEALVAFHAARAAIERAFAGLTPRLRFADE